MRLTRHLIEVKLGLVAVGAAIAALGIATWFSLMTEVRIAESRLDEIAHLEAELHREIGFGGLIHNFKNYILRGAENYRVAALRNHRRASGLVSDLDALVDAEAREYIATVRATLDAYRDSLDVAAAARARGLGPEDVDQMVKIDDSMAVHALGVRMRATNIALVDERDALRDAQLQVFVALCIFLGAILTITVLFARWIILRVRTIETRWRACQVRLAETAPQPTKARSIT